VTNTCERYQIEQMRILILQDTDWLMRYPGQQHHLAEMLSLKGHKIHIIDYEIMWGTQGKRKLYSRREVFNNVSKIHQEARVTVIRPGIIKIPGLDYVSLSFSCKKEINQQIKNFTPDLIIAFSILSAYLGARAARKNGMPFIYYWTDVQHKMIPFRPFQPIAKLMERIIFSRSDGILAINDKLRDYMIKLGASPERTRVLRAGINIDQFNPNTNADVVRKRYRLNKDDIILFFMGWLYNFSGLKEVALRLAHIKNPNLKLLIVGEGDAYKELQRIQQEYSLKDRLILTGRKPYSEIPLFIAAADICLLPAYPWEPIMQDIVPIKMYEYLAMQKPVIATRLSGVMKEFGESNGIIYVDRPEDVLEKAIQLAADGNLKELGAKAKSFVERNSWDNIADEFEGILTEAIKEKQDGQLSKRV